MSKSIRKTAVVWLCGALFGVAANIACADQISIVDVVDAEPPSVARELRKQKERVAVLERQQKETYERVARLESRLQQTRDQTARITEKLRERIRLQWQ